MYKCHLDCLALDAVDKPIADRAAHEEEEADPPDCRGSSVLCQGLVHLVCVEGAVEDDDGPYQL